MKLRRFGFCGEDNLGGLGAILQMIRFSLDNKIKFLRISPSMIPPVAALPYLETDLSRLEKMISDNNFRVSIHSNFWVVLNSIKPNVVKASYKELERYSKFLDRIGGEGDICIHVGGANGDKKSAISRFLQVAKDIPHNIKRYLAVENDDKIFDVRDVVRAARKSSLRVIVDFLHHKVHCTVEDEETQLKWIAKAMETWCDRVPKIHLASITPGTRATHDLFVLLEDLLSAVSMLSKTGLSSPFDIMLEARAGEEALLKLRKEWKRHNASNRGICSR